VLRGPGIWAAGGPEADLIACAATRRAPVEPSAQLRRRRITAAIPEPADQQAHWKRRGPRGGRPPAFDAADYKGRNVIERGFNTVKQWRGLATRYDKLAVVYRGAAVLRAITIWLRHLSGTP
jgi:transposase